MKHQYTRRMVLTAAVGAAGAAALAPLIARLPRSEAFVLQGATMGTTFRVVIPPLSRGVREQHVARDVRGALERVDRSLSTFRADSEVSRFNRAAPGEWVPVSAGTSKVAAAALALAQRSGGAFDPTVAPLVDLWGFGPPGPSRRLPETALVETKRTRLGHACVQVRHEPAALRKHRGGVHVDFSGIAEGFAVDCVAESLEGAGIFDYLVELGGELRCRGSNPAGLPWTIAVETPQPGARDVQRHLDLHRAAVSTSGDYRQFFVIDGRRYSHIIDPRTGAPVDHGLASVTVIDAAAMHSDALSTALLVMGPVAGLEFAERHGVPALFLSRSASGLSERMSTHFARHLQGPTA